MHRLYDSIDVCLYEPQDASSTHTHTHTPPDGSLYVSHSHSSTVLSISSNAKDFAEASRLKKSENEVQQGIVEICRITQEAGLRGCRERSRLLSHSDRYPPRRIDAETIWSASSQTGHLADPARKIHLHRAIELDNSETQMMSIQAARAPSLPGVTLYESSRLCHGHRELVSSSQMAQHRFER